MSVSKSILCHIVAVSALCGRVMAQAPAAAEDIRGPKSVVTIPQPEAFPAALWTGVGGGVLLLVLALFLWRRLARRKRLSSPLVIAFASLAELEKTRNQLAAEAFANRAAGTVRQYIADRFGIAAPRRTTEEFFRELERYGLESVITESDHLKSFLKSCDLAKFAGTNLDVSQRDELIQAARGFITVTSAPHTKDSKS
jgi:hypothetical protein